LRRAMVFRRRLGRHRNGQRDREHKKRFHCDLILCVRTVAASEALRVRP
jgi:hypothetical protein